MICAALPTSNNGGLQLPQICATRAPTYLAGWRAGWLLDGALSFSLVGGHSTAQSTGDLDVAAVKV